jgi:hypothetical protein
MKRVDPGIHQSIGQIAGLNLEDSSQCSMAIAEHFSRVFKLFQKCFKQSGKIGMGWDRNLLFGFG